MLQFKESVVDKFIDQWKPIAEGVLLRQWTAIWIAA